MNAGLALGALFGASLCLLGYVVAAPRPGLGSSIERFERRRRQASNNTWGDLAPGFQPKRERAKATIAAFLMRHGLTVTRLELDLELTGSTVEAHLVRKASYAIGGLLLPAVTTLAIVAVGVDLPVLVPAVLSISLAIAAFWLPDVSVAQAAEARRRELRRALSSYLDLVAMSLAGGRGVPEALPTAARIGTGWAFTLLQDTIEHARYVGTTPWEAFADLGRRTGMPELQDLGGALALVADDGAKVRASLTARASTQRRRQLAEAEGAASKADQSIQLAQVVLACGFFLFLGYPAVVAVMGT